MKICTFLLGLYIAALSFNAIADTYVMPQDLVMQARDQGCHQVSDFYNREGEINPPYIYFGTDDTDSLRPYAFWCEKTSNTNKTEYLLMISSNTIRSFKGCPNTVKYWNYPGGLYFLPQVEVDLANYRNTRTNRSDFSSKKTVKSDLIVSAYDGVEFRLACYANSWYYRILH